MRLHAAPKWLAALALTSLFVTANPANAGGVPYPSIAKGQRDACVADSDFMRRNHMDLLKHQRDETMQQGMRGKPFSLRECLDCHAVPGADGQPVSTADPQHFCRSCHDYAAVSIDCFSCHASRPGNHAGGLGMAK